MNNWMGDHDDERHAPPLVVTRLATPRHPLSLLSPVNHTHTHIHTPPSKQEDKVEDGLEVVINAHHPASTTTTTDSTDNGGGGGGSSNQDNGGLDDSAAAAGAAAGAAVSSPGITKSPSIASTASLDSSGHSAITAEAPTRTYVRERECVCSIVCMLVE